ncbi:MAG: arginase family protein [Bacteroides sp.]|nr:arginase family protein [Bacteroides sp.]MCM1085920.1 arginase family protein [Bacteroides sp.]
MKEIDLSLYFNPCPYMEAGAFYADNTARLGRQVQKFTVPEHFPSVQGAAVAFIGLEESRGGSLDGLRCNGAENVRRELYNLYGSASWGKLVDLGDLKCGKTLQDTCFALSEVISCLLAQNTVVVLLGGTQDLTYAVYRAYVRLHRMANILTVDSRLNIAEGMNADFDPIAEPLSHNSFAARMVVEPDNYLYNYMNVGYQTYLVDKDAIGLMNRLFFDACRYGMLRDNLQAAEPYVRDSDCVSFDLCAVKKADSPANPWARPTGFTAEQACQLARYAGISRQVGVLGLFEYYPALDQADSSAQLMAEMVWCFLDGMEHRSDDHPLTATGVEFKQYIVPLEELEQDLVFHKCKQTDRWWIELPCSEEQKQRYGRHCYLACSYADYQTAQQNEVPARWWSALRRLK